jgi:hypothetical protein
LFGAAAARIYTGGNYADNGANKGPTAKPKYSIFSYKWPAVNPEYFFIKDLKIEAAILV